MDGLWTLATGLSSLLAYTAIRVPVSYKFLNSLVQLVLVSAFVMGSIHFSQFLVFFVLLLTLPPCPVICKSGGVYPVPYGVGTNFVGQFHTIIHYKTAM